MVLLSFSGLAENVHGNLWPRSPSQFQMAPREVELPTSNSQVNQKNTTLGGKRINEAQNQLRIGVHLYPFVLLTARLPHFFQSMNGSSDGCFAPRIGTSNGSARRFNSL